MKKNFKLKTIQKIVGIIALIAIIGFSFAACDNNTGGRGGGGFGGGGGGDDGGETPGSGTGGGSGTGSGTTVSVTGVTLNKTTLSLAVGDTETLTANIAPFNATNKNVTWKSSDTTKATVENGVVTAVAIGSAKITVTTADGNKTATCSVTVISNMKWTAVSNSTFGTSGIIAITYGNNKFVAGGGNGKMAYSTDGGETWTAVTNSTFGDSSIKAIAYGNGKFVAVGYDGKMAVSTDGGITWTAVTQSVFSSYIYAIAYGNNKFVAVGSGGKMAYSTDGGTTWTAVTDSKFDSNSINAIAYGSNGSTSKFVAVGNNGKMATSTDGTTWTAVENSKFGRDNNFIYSIAYGNGIFVAGGEEGKIAYAKINTNWMSANTGTIFDIFYLGENRKGTISPIAYGNGKFVACGNGGKMAVSTDGGETWTAVADSKFGTDSISAIAYDGSKRFVAGGSNGKIAYSDD